MKMTRTFVAILFGLGLFFVADAANANRERDYFQQIAQAFQAQDYATVYAVGSDWHNEVKNGQLPNMGNFYTQLSYVIPVAVYNGEEEGTISLPASEYKSLVVDLMNSHLQINQDKFAAKSSLLARMSKRLYDLEEPKSQDTENLAVWSMWRAVIESQKENQFERPVSKATLGHLFSYVEFSMDMVETTEYPDLYRYRIRHACQLAFGVDADFDEYFWSWYDMTFFDNGNIKAGVLYQKGIDAAFSNGYDDEGVANVSELLLKAVDASRSNKAKAMAYQQLGEFLQYSPEENHRLQANKYAQQAYRLNPYDKKNRELYGATLFAVANDSLAENNYAAALEYGKEGTSFVHDLDYELYMILAKAQQYHGMKIDAIRNARTAYQKACRKAKPDEIENYFSPTYQQILTQFGQGDKFKPCSGARASQ